MIETTTSAAQLVRETSDNLLEMNRRLWEKQGHKNDLRRDIARAYVERSLLDRLKNLIDDGKIFPMSAGGMPFAGAIKFGFATDVCFDVSIKHAKLFSDLSLSVAAEIPHELDEIEAITIVRRQLRADQQSARTAAGRYTILEASNVLAKETGWLIHRWISTIRNAIRNGELPLRNPRDFSDRLPYTVPGNIGIHSDEVDSTGLNRWLRLHSEWGVAYRFPNGLEGDTSSSENAAKITAVEKPRQGLRNRKILDAIRELEYDPRKLPPNPNDGNAWVKAKVFQHLGWPKEERKAFDGAWQRLLDKGKIEALPGPTPSLPKTLAGEPCGEG